MQSAVEGSDLITRKQWKPQIRKRGKNKTGMSPRGMKECNSISTALPQRIGEIEPKVP
jgi:hypothetical protein